MVSLIIDIVFAIICLILIIRNASRGFIKSFMAFARTILAVFLAYLFNAPLAGLFDEKIFRGLATGWVHNAFLSTDDGTGVYHLHTLFDGVPDWFTNVLMRSGADEETIQKYFHSGEGAPIEIVEQFSNSVGALLSSLISTIVAVIVIFIVVELLLLLVGVLLNKAGKLPVIKLINILLGACIGGLFSFAISLLLSTAVIWIIGFGAGYNADIFSGDIITNSLFLNFFHEHNIWQVLKNIVIGK